MAGTGDRGVLIVDDNRDAADTLAVLVRLWGYSAQVAYSGVEGLAALDEFRPHALLVDLGMPRLDGLAFVRRVREGDGPPPVLIAVTGFADPRHREEAQRAGFDHFFAKPTDLGRLQDVLRSVYPG
jgi:CheY-like chemotaxis protein